jgi:hypothetical protein
MPACLRYLRLPWTSILHSSSATPFYVVQNMDEDSFKFVEYFLPPKEGSAPSPHTFMQVAAKKLQF